MTDREFASEPESVAAARVFTAAQLTSVDSEVVDHVLLLVSELASNSVRHAQAPFHLRVDQDLQMITVSVRDRGAAAHRCGTRGLRSRREAGCRSSPRSPTSGGWTPTVPAAGPRPSGS